MTQVDLENAAAPQNISEVLLDGSNSAHLELSPTTPSALNLKRVCEDVRLQFPQCKIICLVDASFRYQIPDQKLLEELIRTKRVQVAPAGKPADVFLLHYLQCASDAILISNDLFRQYPQFSPLVKKCRVPVMVINQLIIYGVEM